MSNVRLADETVRDMYESGMSARAVADATGYTATGVLNKVRRAGGSVRQSGRNFRARGGHVDGQGYQNVTVNSNWEFYSQMARKNGNNSAYVLEHRKVMADSLGRPLRSDETVHHLDGDKLNNAIENLQLRQGRHGKGATYVCHNCGSKNVAPADL